MEHWRWNLNSFKPNKIISPEGCEIAIFKNGCLAIRSPPRWRHVWSFRSQCHLLVTFLSYLLWSRNSSADEGTVVMSASLLAALSLRTAVTRYSALCTLGTELHTADSLSVRSGDASWRLTCSGQLEAIFWLSSIDTDVRRSTKWAS
jgi:hypothetical protein